MRLQGISIIFALIVLPIILVIAYYISLQIDTINLQNKYSTYLLDATYDAMSSFELNTANEDLSTVSDSLRTIIEASDNIFMNALATNLGMSNASKSQLEPYIPAILHTLYDGYYIYAPTYAPTVITDSDGNAVSVGDIGVTANGDGTYNYNEYKEILDENGNVTNELNENQKKDLMISYDNSNFTNKIDYGQLLYYTKDTEQTINADGTFSYNRCTTSVEAATMLSSVDEAGRVKAEYTTKNVLKSYIPYSARYVQSEDFTDSEGQVCAADVNVVYTLDNYVTIEGKFTYPGDRQIYWTKSGYLVPFNNDDLSVKVSFDGTNFEAPLKYNQNEIQEYIEAGNPITIQVLKDLAKPEQGYETIIQIDNTNRAVIDKTNTNTNSDTVKLTRYENVLFDLEELMARVRKGTLTGTDKVQLDYIDRDSDNNPKLDENGNQIIVRTEIGNVIYNALLILGRESEFDEFKDKNPVDLYNFIDSKNLINTIKTDRINPTKYNIQLNSAAVYYAKAAIFSTWVKENLSDLKISSIQDISGLNYTTYTEELVNEASNDKYNYLNLWKSDGYVFEFTNGNEVCGSTEIKQDSSYYTHKLAIIRASIQYNLNLSMSAYNRHLYYADDNKTYAYDKNVDYTMPIMSQSEWEQILSNISIVSFMQGFDCKLKKFNNYVVVSSSNNEVMTTSDNIYYAKLDEFNDEISEYHKYNCNRVKDSITDSDKYISFSSKEVKYDKLSTTSAVLPYTYDHKNLACYECINDGNYSGIDIFDIKQAGEFGYSDELEKQKTLLRKSFYIGVAKERNDVYKMNAVKNSEGYEILFFDGTVNLSEAVRDKTTNSLLGMNKIKQIEVTFGAVNTDRRDEASLTFAPQYNSRNLRNQYGTTDSILYSIPTNTTNKYTWNIEVDPEINVSAKFSLQQLIFYLQNAETSSFVPQGDNLISRASEKLKGSIVAIRIIYK